MNADVQLYCAELNHGIRWCIFMQQLIKRTLDIHDAADGSCNPEMRPYRLVGLRRSNFRPKHKGKDWVLWTVNYIFPHGYGPERALQPTGTSNM